MYFTSDLHLGHKKMLEVRPFDTIEEHDDHIIGQLKKINPRSEIWILGDISCGAEEYALERLGEVPARMHLVSGNHDSVWPGHRGAHRQQIKFLQVFDSVQSTARVDFGGRKVMLHHIPETRDLPSHKGQGHLHGHTHSTRKITYFNSVNVALEAWDYRVARQEEIVKQFEISDLIF